ncbi:MAG: YbaB/EbfC family nucleoid-associated protein [Spirochaetales bacterium]|nr:YbaB/EbfC family nucleoid-associated protein [Spirochaetales bacterium]
MNPFDMMKNLQNLQGQMGDIQSKLNDIKAEGSSGGDIVRVTINGQMEVQDVHIDPIAVDPRDVGMLEDLIVAAFNAAQANVKDKIQAELGALAGGMNLPPGFPGV